MRAVLALSFALLACGSEKKTGDDDGSADASVEADAMPDAFVPTCDPDADPYGRCVGDMLATCTAGVPGTIDCTGMGKVCAWQDDTVGYACVDLANQFLVSGTVSYEDKPPMNDGSLGPIAPHPARGARVSVVLDQGSTVLASATVADDGTYRLRYTTTAGDMVHIMASAQSPLPARPVTVQTRQKGVHGFGGTSFAAAAATTSDVLVTDASGKSEAFNILDQLVGTMDKIRVVLGDATPVPLTAQWAVGSTDGTYYDQGAIHLLGQASDDDGYDDTVILHESGHYVEDTQGRSDSPGGSHDGSPTDPRLAWSEGFSTYWGMVVRGAPHYMDSNANGGWGYDADTTVTAAAMPAGTMSQDVSEDMVTEDLWDLGDGKPNDDDGVDDGHAAVLRVQVDYLKPGVFRNVGVTGVDLVDALDGWFIKVGLPPCAEARGIITTTRTFPYDYAGPAGACP